MSSTDFLAIVALGKQGNLCRRIKAVTVRSDMEMYEVRGRDMGICKTHYIQAGGPEFAVHNTVG